jgi:FlaG/FlaF family flagellin (archaellin)
MTSTKIPEKKEVSKRDHALSPVIGEMILIALIFILIPSVTISLMHQLPQDRIPTVFILMHSESPSVVSLYHKGGDYINLDDIDIFVQDEKLGNTWKERYQSQHHKILFDLGDVITIDAEPGNRITFVAKKAVIFRGGVPRET